MKTDKIDPKIIKEFEDMLKGEKIKTNTYYESMKKK